MNLEIEDTPYAEAFDKLSRIVDYSEKVASDLADKYTDPELRNAILIANFFSSIGNTRSILALSEIGIDYGMRGILRTMLEELINAKFIIDDKSGIMAKAYYIDGESRLAGIIATMIAKGVPKYFTKPEKEWQAKLNEIRGKIDEVIFSEPTVTIKWPVKKDRALSAGLIDAYFITEWLFSQDIHSTPYSLDRFLLDDSGVIKLNADQITKTTHSKEVVSTAIGLLSTFINLCSDELGIPEKDSLQGFMESL